jgi:hypothetical protein
LRPIAPARVSSRARSSEYATGTFRSRFVRRPSLALAAFFFAAATSTVAATAIAQDRADTASPCSRAELARAFDLPDDLAHVFVAEALADGSVFAAASANSVPAGDSARLDVRLARLASCTARASWTATHTFGSNDPDDPVSGVLGMADGLSLRILHEDSLGPEWLRVGVIAQFGEDFATTTELVMLYRLAADDVPSLVWSGIGSTNENQNGTCRIDHVVEFRRVDESTIVRVDTASARPRARSCQTTAARSIRIRVR